MIVSEHARGNGCCPQRGKFLWSAFAEGRAPMDATAYPANHSTGSGLVGTESCTRGEAALGTCTPGPLLTWNPLEAASPFRTAFRGSAGASVSGGLGRLGYVASASLHNEAGALAPNDVTRYATRLNLDAQVLPNLRLGLNSAYVRSRVTCRSATGEPPRSSKPAWEGTPWTTQCIVDTAQASSLCHWTRPPTSESDEPWDR